MSALFTLKEVLEVVSGRLNVPGDENLVFSAISTDTRQVKPGELFIPLKGEKFNGHAFIPQALTNPGTWALAAENYPPVSLDDRLIWVKDPIKAYHQLAQYHRQRFKDLKVIGITGSCGKTTTKDIITGLLAIRYNLLHTPGNFNNEVGVPQTLLKLTSDHKVLVLEMGMRGLGEIHQLAQLALPDIGVITNIGESHLEMLGSLQNIVTAKCELLDELSPAGLAVINADSIQLKDMQVHCKERILTFGIENSAEIRLMEADSLNWDGWRLKIKVVNQLWEVKVPFLGEQIFYNILAAIAVAWEFGLTEEEVNQAFQALAITPMRMEKRLTQDGIYLINDAYNASPVSMANALKAVKELKISGRKFAVLGDMLELGERSHAGHWETGQLAARSGLFALLCMGDRGMEICQAALGEGMENCRHFPEKAQVVEFLRKNLKSGDLLLLKASRRMELESIARDLWGEAK